MSDDEQGFSVTIQVADEAELKLLLAQLSGGTTAMTFALADLLAHGEDAFSVRVADAWPDAPWSYQTLANAAYVARAIPPARRHPALSFGYHSEVAALDAVVQTAMLAEAAEQGWTRAELRAAVRAWRDLERAEACVTDATDAPRPDLTSRAVKPLG